MKQDGEIWVRSTNASRKLGISRPTLNRWADAGYIRTMRAPGHNTHRLFNVKSLHRATTKSDEPDTSDTSATLDVIYARVSTKKQADDLQRQIDRLKKHCPSANLVLSDIASGLNFKRKGLQALLELSCDRRIRRLHIAHRDRLCRFSYDMLEYILRRQGAEVIVDAPDPTPTPEGELARDILDIVTVFGARLYGGRSRGRKRQREPTLGDEATEKQRRRLSKGVTQAIEHPRDLEDAGNTDVSNSPPEG